MKLTDKQKTELILQCLVKHFSTWGRERSNIIFPELRLGSGYCGVAQRRIDLFIINSAAGNETTAFEIKVSRNDFKHDLDNDLKQRGARLYANKFIYVTPKGLVKPDEVPIWAGLWEIDLNSDYAIECCNFRETVPTPLHPRAMPSWGLICSIVRKINKDKLITDVICEKDAEIAKLKERINSLERKLTERYFKPITQ